MLYILYLIAGSLKRKETEEESSSEDRSWNSTELGGAKKYVKIYVSSTYAETDFGGSDDNKSSVSLLHIK